MTLYRITKAKKYEIRPMLRGPADAITQDRIQGRDAHRRLKRKRANASAARLKEIKEILEGCRFSKEPCPNADHNHVAIKSNDVLYCPLRIMFWKSMVAFKEGTEQEFLRKLGEGDGANALIRETEERRDTNGE
jgi:hypothetical protein